MLDNGFPIRDFSAAFSAVKQDGTSFDFVMTAAAFGAAGALRVRMNPGGTLPHVGERILPYSGPDERQNLTNLIQMIC